MRTIAVEMDEMEGDLDDVSENDEDDDDQGQGEEDDLDERNR